MARRSLVLAREGIRAVSLLESPVPALWACASAGRRALVAVAAHQGYAVVVSETAREAKLDDVLLAATGASPELDGLVPAWQQLVVDAEEAGITVEVAWDDVEAAVQLAESMIDLAIALVDGAAQ